ncbi:MAG: hypothetical protein A3B82_03975 [Methylophilales bacterium RIFCSPHIGHO2_02_FULL_57_10]|nr:MAG: hypothetical protein A3B82_03975 [Methylophilales bacterium RIFCSPHIGHO2_02_FULL_57_10]
MRFPHFFHDRYKGFGGHPVYFWDTVFRWRAMVAMAREAGFGLLFANDGVPGLGHANGTES